MSAFLHRAARSQLWQDIGVLPVMIGAAGAVLLVYEAVLVLRVLGG